MSARAQNDSLFAAVCDIENLQHAWAAVWARRTTAARCQGAGIDGLTVADWAADWPGRLRALQLDLLSGAYRPAPLHRFDIPRREPEAMRRLSIPTVTDRVAQRAVKNVVEPIWEARFLSCSHGFRPERSVYTAVAHVLWHAAQGRRWVVDADIEDCFDNIDHDRLLAQIDGHGDVRLTNLIGGWLETGAVVPGRGVAQGAVLSPLLANIYLHRFDVVMIQTGLALVRYADDFVVMCAELQEAQASLEYLAETLSGLGLALNPDKTAIAPLGQGFTFLGAQFVD